MWNTEVSYGWNSDAPPCVAEIIAEHSNHGSKAVFALTRGPHLGGDHESVSSIYNGDEPLGAIATACSKVVDVISTLANGNDDGIGLAFVNFASSGPIVKPPARKVDTQQDFAAALFVFLKALSESIKPVDINSACDWVVLSCVRTPGDQ
ncbi:MAG TPA: hypothetical protein VGG64_19200 [Pirellulales bacterium]|jgi:hypothetical protein